MMKDLTKSITMPGIILAMLVLPLVTVLQAQETDKKIQIEVFYKEQPPSMETLTQVKDFLKDYQDKCTVKYLLMTETDNEKRMTSYGYPSEHFPFGIAINGKTSARIGGEVIIFGNFPDFMHHLGRHQGNWTFTHLRQVLNNKELLLPDNPTFRNQPGGGGDGSGSK